MWLWNPGNQESDAGDVKFEILGVEMGGGQGGAPWSHRDMPLQNGTQVLALCCRLAQLAPAGSQTTAAGCDC